MRRTGTHLVTLALGVGAAGLALTTGAQAAAAAAPTPGPADAGPAPAVTTTPLPPPPGLQGLDPHAMAGQSNGFVEYGVMNPGYDTRSPAGRAIEGSPRPAYPERTLAGAPALPRETALYTLRFYSVPDSMAQHDNPRVAGTETSANSDWDGADLVLLPGVTNAHLFMYCGSDQRHQGVFMEHQAFRPDYGVQQTLHGGGSAGDLWVRWFHHLLFLPWGG
jgi:hypothetical protein